MAKIHKDSNKEKNDKIFNVAANLLNTEVNNNGLYNAECKDVKHAVALAKILYEEVYNSEDE